MAYIALFTLATLNYSKMYFGADNVINKRFPSTFIGQLNLLINREFPITLVLAVVLTTATLIMLSGNSRKYLIVWIFSSIILFLNPVTSAFLIDKLVTPNIYWRLFFILPFPLMAGFCVVAFLTRVKLDTQTGNGRAFVVILLAALLSAQYIFWNASVFNPNNGSQIGWAEYKLQKHLLESARQIIGIAPRGVMLAPVELSGTIAMLSGDYPQIRVRSDAEHLWLDAQGLNKEAELRINASQYIGGDVSNIESLKLLLLKYPSIQSIVMDRNVWKIKEVVKLVADHGYNNYQAIKRYVIVWR